MKAPNTSYLQKKQFFKQILTIYGRNPVFEALQNLDLQLYRLHLADSNKPSASITTLEELARNRGIEICYHSKQALSRISKNSKQDQGVALDIRCQKFTTFEEFNKDLPKQFEVIALDNITNPQNLGMIIRSICASDIKALILPQNGCAKLDALVIKASAGTLFKAPIVFCEDLPASLKTLREQHTSIYALDASAKLSLAGFAPPKRSVYVLGNETEGVSAAVRDNCNERLKIPMQNGVESLNVSITAALLAFRPILMGA